MELEALKERWQQHAPPGGGAQGGIDMSELIGKLDRLENDVRRRDLREMIAALAVMAFFTWRAVMAQETLERVGAVIVVLGSAFIIVWSRHKASLRGGDAVRGELPVVQFCRRELARVDAQIRLLRTVWLWYVAPTIVGIELMTLRRWEVPSVTQVVVMAIVLAVGIAIHWLNVFAARHGLMPLREELEERIAELSR